MEKLQKVIQELEKKFGKGIILTGRELDKLHIEQVSTGSIWLDHCLTGETEIFDYGSGLPLKIKDIVENKISAKVISFKESNESFGNSYAEFTLSLVSNWFKKSTKQPTIKITTSYGIPISTTLDHKLLTNKGWKEARELERGNYLIRPIGSQINLGDNRLDRDYLRFLGYWLGDGSSDINKTPTIASIDKSIIKDLLDIAKSKGYKLTHVKPISYNFSSGLPPIRSWDGRIIATNKFNLFLKDLNLLGKHSKDKIIPKKIFSLRKEYIAEVLRGLFMTDGTINKIKPSVGFFNISEIMVKQIQYLLLVNKIKSYVWENKNNSKGNYSLWTLNINGIENLRRFSKFIHLTGDKGKRLKYWCQQSVRENRDGKQRLFGNEAICEKITKIEGNGLQTVYDLTTRKEHNYLANGHICHNCLSGGLPRGRTVELYGPEGSGKSLISQRTVAEAQKQGLDCVWIDAENAWSSKFARKLGVDTKKLIVIKESEGEFVFNTIEKFLEAKPGVIVVDSVASLLPIFEEENPIEKQGMALLARLMSKALRKITGKVARANTLLIFINQIRENIGAWGNPMVTPGGRALKFHASVRVEIRRGAWITMKDMGKGDTKEEKKRKVGQVINFNITKSKVSKPHQTGSFRFFFEGVIDEADEIISLLEYTKKIQRKGAMYSIAGKKIRGRVELRKLVRKDEEFKQRLIKILQNI